LGLIPDYVWAEVSIRTVSIALLAQLLREIEDECHWKNMKLARQFNQRLARIRLNICGVNCREFPQSEPLPGDEMKDFERIASHRLVVLVVGNEAAAEVR
jgi:acetylornithine deacetylase/succinyl-diaminopimelate desuccinylase-like protein